MFAQDLVQLAGMYWIGSLPVLEMLVRNIEYRIHLLKKASLWTENKQLIKYVVLFYNCSLTS